MGRPSPLGIEGTALSFRDPDERGRPTVAMVRARDERGAWQAKRFAVVSWRKDGTPIMPETARDWARETRKTFMKGQAVAAVATLQEHAGLLVENLEAAGVGEGRLNLIRAVSSGLLAEGITDMRSDAFPARVRKWIAGLRAGWSFAADARNRPKGDRPLSAATRNKLLIICRQVTGLAVRKRRLAFDPLGELPRFKETETIKALFSIAELRHLVGEDARNHAATELADLEAAIAKHAGQHEAKTATIKRLASARKVHWSTIYNALGRNPEPDPWWLACCLLVYTGCRAQEAMHLRWEWIRWEEGIITLKLAADYDQKTDSERLIPLEPELREILRPMAKPAGHILAPEIRAGGSGVRTRKESAKTGKGARDYTAALRRYLGRIGLEIGDRTAHSLRHTYITTKLARADTNVDRLRKAVGHADFSTTMGYGRWSQLYEAEVDRWPDSSLWLRRPVATARVVAL